MCCCVKMIIDKRVFVLIIAMKMCISNCARVKRVVGGSEVECGVQPRVASLRNATTLRHLCGATLLTTNFALTAAHCVFHPENTYVLQLNNVCTDGGEYPKVEVLESFKNPLFNEVSRAHDIAILRIDSQRDLDDITSGDGGWLPHSSFGISGECTIYGYGSKEVGSDITSDVLLAASVRLVSLDDCTEALGIIAPTHDGGMMCALGDNADSCQGDSGSPLVCQGELQALSSHGLSCGAPGVPGVYTAIGPHLQWIRQVIHEESSDS